MRRQLPAPFAQRRAAAASMPSASGVLSICWTA